MSTMAAFVEELIEDHSDVLEMLPEGCTANLVNDKTWRAESTLAERPGGVFVVLRFELQDFGGECFRAQFTLRQWHPVNGITATEFLPVGDVAQMMPVLGNKLSYWKVKPEIANGEVVRQFLRFVRRMDAALSSRYELEPNVPV